MLKIIPLFILWKVTLLLLNCASCALKNGLCLSKLYSFKGNCLVKSCIVIPKLEEYNGRKTTGCATGQLRVCKNSAATKRRE